MLWKVEEKGFFCSLAPIGVGFSGIMCNLTPYYDGLVRKVLQDDDLAPFSSDKIRAKILDLGMDHCIPSVRTYLFPLAFKISAPTWAIRSPHSKQEYA